MIKLITSISVPLFRSRQKLGYPFVILKMIKKHFKDRERLVRPKPETYSASEASQKKEEEMQIFDTDYDFFSRQKQIELNKDYRKIRDQSLFIPQDIGKGGFEEIVYWSEFAKTPEQVIELVKVFNRTPTPEQIVDTIRFQAFGDMVMKTVYLCSNFDTLQEFATFGERYSINEPSFWQKIEEKVVRIAPKNAVDAKDCIEIAFIMSKLGQGQIIYSSLLTMFKSMEISAEDKAKLLNIYANTETGDKNWISALMNSLVEAFPQIRKEVFLEVLKVFQKSKQSNPYHQQKILEHIQKILPTLNFRELCVAGSFIGHGKMPDAFWRRLETLLIPQIPQKKPKYTALHLLEILSSYSLSTEFTRAHLLPLLRNKNHELIKEFRPEILSAVSKILYIYELETEAKDIEELIESQIIKTYTKLENVEIECLIRVIQDYSVTRNGSRELYIFLEQVADALFLEIAKKRESLETLCALYENSQLCTPEFLQKLQFSL